MRILVAAAALVIARTACAAGEVSVGTGIDFTTGDYGGSSKTDIVTIPVFARYDTDAWSFKATVPYLRISGPAIVPGVGRVENPGRGRRASQTNTVSGMGDATLAATYTMYSTSASRSGVGLTGKLKLATGDELQGLGTGSNDVSFQVDGFQEVDRANTVFGAVGYTVFGDSPIVELKNVVNLGVGASHRIEGGDSIGLAFDARQGATPAPAPRRELTAYWTHRMEGNWRTQAYFVKGFADGSPDWGLGLNASYTF